MNNFLIKTLDFVAQFTGGRGGIDHVVNYAIGSILFAILLAIAVFQRFSRNGEREKLLVWGFGIGLGRELFMIFMSYIQALGLLSPETLHVIFPPLEHALSNIATITIAAAFLRYLLNDIPRSQSYLRAGLCSVLLCYFATFMWWAQHITAEPSSKFGQTWCDWLFRINASIWMLIPTIWLLKKTKGWLRNTVCGAFTLFFLTEFLKLPDMALAEVYEGIFTPFRHGFYLLAIPLFGYVYIREMYDQSLKERDDKIKVIEEKIKLEHQLNQSQKMEAIGTLAGGIAHDFNNILGIILGNADMGLMDTGEDAKNKSFEAILKAANRAKDLVRQILFFSRSNEQELLMPIQSQVVIKEGVKLLRSSLPSTIEIKNNIENSCGSIIVDPTKIHQILMNLATNAVHAMGSKGTLTINLERIALKKENVPQYPAMEPGLYIHLMVGDTGTGMDPTLIQKIFEPFFTTKAVHEGTGLGLAIVQKIISKYGGMVTVDSEKGKGSTFHVYFAETKSSDISKSTELIVTKPSGSEHILWVDDEEDIVQIGKRILEKNGYKVTTTTDSKLALKTFSKHPDDFDLLITDQTMPKITGTELIAKVLQIKPNFPVILCTGYNHQVTEEQIKKLGIDHFYIKPMDYQQICCAVRKILDLQEKPAPVG